MTASQIHEQEIADAIALDIKRIHEESYGAGSVTAHSHFFEDTVVVLLDDLELQPNEAFLVESGKGESVIAMRHEYQKAIRATFSAAVERATGRRVVAFVSDTHLDPHFSVELFRLGPKERV